MSVAVLLIVVGLIVLYAVYHARKAELDRRRNNGDAVDLGRGLELELDDDRRVRVHDERAAANGLYSSDDRKVQAVRSIPPRPPQP